MIRIPLQELNPNISTSLDNDSDSDNYDNASPERILFECRKRGISDCSLNGKPGGTLVSTDELRQRLRTSDE